MGGLLFLKPDRSGMPVGVEAFDFAEGLDEGERFPKRFFAEPHDAGAALELIGGEAGEGFARSAGGKFVARTGDKIAAHHR